MGIILEIEMYIDNKIIAKINMSNNVEFCAWSG